MGEIIQIYNVLKNINPIFLLAILSLIAYGVIKWLPKHLKYRKTQYEGIFTALTEINSRLEKIEENIEKNNKHTKELYIDELKERIYDLHERFNKDGIKPSQEEIDHLYHKWSIVEDLGDGFIEVKSSLDTLKEMMY